MRNDLPYTLCMTPERWMGSRVASTVGCFPELCFLQFSVAQVLVWLRMPFINNFVFPKWACAAGFNNNCVGKFNYCCINEEQIDYEETKYR